jgi:hypothetical protein
MHQGPYESIITYKERFDIALRAYQEQDNADMTQPDIAMNFFDGLDNGRYAEFKKSILNGMTAGSVTQPATLNEMYLLANQWLKTIGVSQSGLASTFVTKLDLPSQGEKERKRQEKNKNNSKEKDGEAPSKPKRDLRSSVSTVGNSVTLLPTVQKRRRRQKFKKTTRQKQTCLCCGRMIGKTRHVGHMLLTR